MLTAQRKKLILSRLTAEGQIVAKELAQELGTSEDTIRRDLRELAQGGKLQRVHGGALPASAAVGDLKVREQVSTRDKSELGRAGASMIRPNQVVILDGGTTALQVACHLAPDLHATIVTHSPTVAVEAAKHPYVDIIMLGGRLFRHSMVNVGAAVIDAASRLRAAHAPTPPTSTATSATSPSPSPRRSIAPWRPVPEPMEDPRVLRYPVRDR